MIGQPRDRKGQYGPTARPPADISLDGSGAHEYEMGQVAQRFGVARAQVERDVLVSHMLAAIAFSNRDDFVFFGGTALSRTHLRDGRLSEDIDLIAVGDRATAIAGLKSSLRPLGRRFGPVSWEPDFSDNDVDAAVLLTGDLSVKVQVLRAKGYEPWPTELAAVEQRYSEVPPATLVVPTLEAFVGWKTTAWLERASARDLWDLQALAQEGALSRAAADLFARHGSTSSLPREWMFRTAPSQSEWEAQLAGQTVLLSTAASALRDVRTAWSEALDEDWTIR